MSSKEFAEMFYHSADEGGSRMAFFLGGADGLPEAVRSGQQREALVSKSKLTFTHQLARMILFEQIYRSSEIRKGSCYHKWSNYEHRLIERLLQAYGTFI